MFVYYLLVFGFFFFKQKTAYEMRISDWSSDVCSSDLIAFDHATYYRPFPQVLLGAGGCRHEPAGGQRRAAGALGNRYRAQHFGAHGPDPGDRYGQRTDYLLPGRATRQPEPHT